MLGAAVDAAIGISDAIDDPLVQDARPCSTAGWPTEPTWLMRWAALEPGTAPTARNQADTAEMVPLHPETQVTPLTWRRRMLSPAVLELCAQLVRQTVGVGAAGGDSGAGDDDGKRIELLDVYVRCRSNC